ncbi:MAG: hypothetical protein A2V88_08570 [Elusimicrobia bacterium RBG_16_66_12]|nr:MAG: hypothetical protein A2V88_08570 [Elusimicrobia bacterium RBG_16_66_12]
MSTTSLDTTAEGFIGRIGSRFKGRSGLNFALITVVNVAVFVIVWELVATYSGIPKLFLPKISAIASDIPQMNAEGILLLNLWFSVKNFFIGLAVGVVIGLPLAYAIGSIKFLDRVLSPYLWALYSIPRIILLPLVLLWVGINNNARLAIVAISVLPSLAVVVMDGVKTTDATMLRAARIFGASRWQQFLHVIVPSTIPFIGTGLRMGMLRGLIGLYIGELFITQNGIGSIIAYASVRFRTARVFAVLLLFVLFAVSNLAVTRAIETRLTRWRAPSGL